LYEFLRNDKFDAWDPFVKIGNAANPLIKKPEYRQNQFGGSIGGPIPRMAQTFFFGDYEAIRNVQGQPSVTTVPTLYEEQNPGDFTDIGSVKLGRLDPVGLNYFKLFPKPTLAAPVSYNNFISSPNNTQTIRSKTTIISLCVRPTTTSAHSTVRSSQMLPVLQG
jgi:hypothetical protein